MGVVEHRGGRGGRLPGQLEREPHGHRRRQRCRAPSCTRWSRPLLVIISMVAFGSVIAAFPAAALGGLVIYAAIRLVDIARVPAAVAVPAQGVPPGRDGLRRRAAVRHPLRRAGGRRHLRGRAAHPGRAAARGRPRAEPGGGRLARRRRLSGVDADPRARGLPLRLAALLRQRRALHQAVHGGHRRGRAAGALVPAEHGGQHRGRHHGTGRTGGRAVHLRASGDRPGTRASQARDPRRPGAGTASVVGSVPTASSRPCPPPPPPTRTGVADHPGGAA